MFCKIKDKINFLIVISLLAIDHFVALGPQNNYSRGVLCLGSARILAREPRVFKSSARLGSISGSSRKLEVIFFGSKARTITRP